MNQKTNRLAESTIMRGRRVEFAEFDNLCEQGKISDPLISSFGDGYGEPYNPHRLVYDYRDNELVWTET